MFKKKFPSLSSLGSDGNTSFLRAARAGHLDKVLEQLKNNVDINTSNANGLNALHLASKDGHIHVVTELLKRGANVDSATKKGNTALHIASLAGQEEVVKLLVEHGASVNVQSQNGFTPLYMAAQENHDNVVRFLLSNGANQSLATEDGFTPLAVAMQQGHDKVVAVLLENDTRGKVRLPALHIAAKKDDCKAAALLLQNEHNPDVTSKSGFTPLHIASHYGNQGIANLLLNKGADVNYSAKHNITPLHVAAKWGKSNMVGLLLEKGANIESKTRDGLTPLHCAARSGHEQVVDMLLERGAPISSKTKNGLAPLHMSSQGDHVDAARILLYHRAPVDEVTVDYLTALHVAAHCGHARVAKLLLDRKADPNARALNGFTPLHIACKKNRIKVVELLLKHGASIEATTESGLTPLHVASFMGCMNIVIYLLQNEANPDVPTVRGETPLHLAARANQTDIIRILLRNGAQVDARAREQQTPLHIAARLGNVDIVMLLLQHGAAVDSTTKDLYTALHIAAKEGQDEVAQVLLENGASPTATTKKGFTPLHLASKYGNMKVASLLLQRDAPVDAQGKNGVTPLHVASHYDHQNVALLLLDKGASPHATAKNGHTPLHIAAKKNQMDIATTLLEYGAKADIESKAGFTPLHLSAQEGHIDMTSLLIDHQADTNHKAKNGLTPLHLCAQEDRVNVATVLMKNGAEVDATTKAGYTPLHVASHFGQLNMVRFLVDEGAKVGAITSVGYTPLHQAAQQGHSTIVNTLLESGAPPNATTNQGQTALSIAQKLGYISVVESLKGVTEPTNIITTNTDEKYKVVSPETMQETFMSDSEDEGGEDTLLSEQPYRYLTVDEMKSLGDDSLPIDVTRDERADSNRECMTAPPTAVDDTISPQHLKETYSQFGTPDNVDISSRHPLHVGFLVSFLVDARGGAMRGCRHSGVRVIVPPRRASQPMRVTCRYLKRDKLSHPPPLMEGEALASRILELGPVGAKFLGPVMIEVPHFGSLRGKEREIVILRSDNGETWREHTVDANEDAIQDILSHSFDKEEISQLEDAGRTTRILTTDFPHYFAVVTRVRQEVHAIGPEGGMVSSSVVPQVQAVFPQGALTKKIKVGLQAQPISAELAAKLLGNRVAVSPIVTVEPRRRKFHKPITLTIPKPQAANKGMINQYSGDAPTLRLLCSITGGTTRAQWEDVTGSTPFTFVNDCVSFTTTVSARFWLMDCRNVVDATKMATELYREAIHVPFMAKFVVFAKRVGELEARLRVFCMTDDKEDKTLEHQEHFTEVAKSRDVEVLEGKSQYVEFAGNLIPVTKSGEQLQLGFRAFRENRLPFTVRVKDPHADTIGRTLFMREPKVSKGEPPQQPICILNIVLPEEIIPETGVLDHDLHKYNYIKDSSGLESYQRADLRLSDISNLLGEDWVSLAEELNISTSDINKLKTDYPNSDAQQGLAMLRLWLQKAGNKAQASTLEAALSRLGRDDIIQQCVFNIDQTGFDLLKEELGPSRDASLKRDIRVDNVYTDQDIMKDSESIEELSRLPHKKAGESVEKDDKEERKYVAEEKEVEEKKRSVSERRKEIEERLLQDKEKLIDKQVTKVVVEETIVTQKQKIAEDLTEKEIAEEKKLSPEESEPSDLTFEQKRLSFEKGKKLIELKPDKKKAEVKKDIDEKFISEEIRLAESEIDETSIPFQEKRLSFEQGQKREEKLIDDHRRDSELFEGVSQGLVSLDKTFTTSPQDLLSPKVSKTPPPSPAEFKDTTGTVPWQEEHRSQIEVNTEPVQDWATKRKPESGIDVEKLGPSQYEIHSTLRTDEAKEETSHADKSFEDLTKPVEHSTDFTSFYQHDTIQTVKSFIEAEVTAIRNIPDKTQIPSIDKPDNNLEVKTTAGKNKLDENFKENSDKTNGKSESKSEKSFVGKVSKKIFGVFKKDNQKDKSGKAIGDMKEKSKGKGSQSIEVERGKEKLEENITIETVLETKEKVLTVIPEKVKDNVLEPISDSIIKAGGDLSTDKNTAEKLDKNVKDPVKDDINEKSIDFKIDLEKVITDENRSTVQIEDNLTKNVFVQNEVTNKELVKIDENSFSGVKIASESLIKNKENMYSMKDEIKNISDVTKTKGSQIKDNLKDKAVDTGEAVLGLLSDTNDNIFKVTKVTTDKVVEGKDSCLQEETEKLSSVMDKTFEINKIEADKIVEYEDNFRQQIAQIEKDVKVMDTDKAASENQSSAKTKIFKISNSATDKINEGKKKGVKEAVQTDLKIKVLDITSEKLSDDRDMASEVKELTIHKVVENKDKAIQDTAKLKEDLQNKSFEVNKATLDEMSDVKGKITKDTAYTKKEFEGNIDDIGETTLDKQSLVKDKTFDITKLPTDKVIQSKNKIIDKAAQTKEDIKDMIIEFDKVTTEKLSDAKDKTFEITKPAADKVVETSNKTIQQAVQKKDDMKVKVVEIGEEMSEKLSDGKDTVFERIKLITDKVVERKNETAQETSIKKEDTVVQDIINIGKSTSENLSESKNKAFDITMLAADKVVDSKNKVSQEATQTKEDVKDIVVKIGRDLSENLTDSKIMPFELTKTAADKITDGKDKITKDTALLKDELKHKTVDFGEAIIDAKVRTIGKSTADKVTEEAALTKIDLQDTTAHIATATPEILSDFKDKTLKTIKLVSNKDVLGQKKVAHETPQREENLNDKAVAINKAATDNLLLVKNKLDKDSKLVVDDIIENKDKIIQKAGENTEVIKEKGIEIGKDTSGKLSDVIDKAFEMTKLVSYNITEGEDEITQEDSQIKVKANEIVKVTSEKVSDPKVKSFEVCDFITESQDKILLNSNEKEDDFESNVYLDKVDHFVQEKSVQYLNTILKDNAPCSLHEVASSNQHEGKDYIAPVPIIPKDNTYQLSDVKETAKSIVDGTLEKLVTAFPKRQADFDTSLKKSPIETLTSEKCTTEELCSVNKHVSEPNISNTKKEDEKFTNMLIDMLIEQESMKMPVLEDTVSENQGFDSSKISVTSTKPSGTVPKSENRETFKKSDSPKLLSPKPSDQKHILGAKLPGLDLRSSTSDDVLEYFCEKSKPESTERTQSEENIISYVTTPTLQRRGIGGSQRLSREERPALRDVSHLLSESSSDEEENAYIVTEPLEKSPQGQRKVTFRFDSEEDPNFEPSSDSDSEIDVQEMTPSPVPPIGIERKLDVTLDKELNNETGDKKIKRVERRFERMASETLDVTDSVVSNAADQEFQRMVSQLSNEEVDACLTAWDEGGMTPSDDLDSKDTTSGDLEDGLEEQLPQASIFSSRNSFDVSEMINLDEEGNDVPSSMFWAFANVPTRNSIVEPDDLDIPIIRKQTKDEPTADEVKTTSQSTAEISGAREGEENLFELAAGFHDTPPSDETDALKKSSPPPKPQ